MDTRCTPTRFSHIRTKLFGKYCQIVARTVKLPYRPQQKALRIIWHQNSSSNAVANFGFPSPWPTSGFRRRGQHWFSVADGINGERERGGQLSIKLLETFSSNAVVNVGFPSPNSVCGGDGINGGRERGNSPSIELLETSSSNAVVNFGFPSPYSGCGGDGIKGGGGGGGDGGGGGEGGGGDGGGGGEGEGGGEEEERFEGEKPMIGSPEIGRWLESRGKYRTAADELSETPHILGGSGREPDEIPYILDGSGRDPDESLFSGGLGRLMADEFFPKLLIECGDDGLFPKNAAEYQKYKENMLKELEIAAADVMRFRADSMMKPVQIGEKHPGDTHGEEF